MSSVPKNILAVGPVSGPITGQAKAFGQYVKLSSMNISVVDKMIGNDIKSPFRLFKYLFRVFILLVSRRYNSLYITTSRTSFGFFLDLYVILIFKVFNRGRVVNHLHGADFLEFRRKFYFKGIVDYVYGKIDTSIVLCERMKEQYSLFKKMRVVVVPNFSSTKSNSISRHTDPDCSVPRSLHILYLSNLIYSKGILHLIRVASQLQKSGFNINVTVAGNYMPDSFMSGKVLKDKCQSYWSERITYVGCVSGVDKEQLLNEADVMFLPTFYETEAQPISLIEGMAHGLYIVTTDHNYNKDFLPDVEPSVIYIKKNSDDAIRDALVKLCSSSIYFRKSFDNFEYFSKNFSLENYINRIDEVVI